MGTSGYTETEKIKILYEESLKDIGLLTTKLETISSELNSSAATVHEVEKLSKLAIREASETFKELANKEMERAGGQAIELLAKRVAVIASNIAGDSAKAERNKSALKLTYTNLGALVISAIIFGGTGYVVHQGASAAFISKANNLVAEANTNTAKATAALAAYQAIVDKNFTAEIEKNKVASGWAATPDGRLAKAFFDGGAGKPLATCTAKYLEKLTDDEKNVWCSSKRQELFGGENNKLTNRWKIP